VTRLAVVTLPMTSFSTPICGSHGSSGNGVRTRPRVAPLGGTVGTRGLGVLRGLFLLRRPERIVDHA
jgi:hypothetical protein